MKYAIGRGGFGKVWKVEYKRDNNIYGKLVNPKARNQHKILTPECKFFDKI